MLDQQRGRAVDPPVIEKGSHLPAAVWLLRGFLDAVPTVLPLPGASSGGERVFELLPEERRFDEAAFSVDDDLDAVVFAAAELWPVLDEAAQSHLLAFGIDVGDADRPCEAGEPDEAGVVGVSGEHAARHESRAAREVDLSLDDLRRIAGQRRAWNSGGGPERQLAGCVREVLREWQSGGGCHRGRPGPGGLEEVLAVKFFHL